MKKIILRLSNEIGNQMFMYASAYSISKKMNRNLFLDNETAFLSKKNVSKYGLYNFNITSPIIEDKLKFKNKYGYIKRKFLLKTEFLRPSKKFFIEKKDRHKITFFDEKFINNRFNDVIYLEGHFESPKYFINDQNDIVNEFKFKDELKFKKIPFFNQINFENSVGICIRQNRFSEGRGQNTSINDEKSRKFTLEQIRYINKSVSLIKTKINNPIFYLWSNDLNSIPKDLLEFEFKKIDLTSQKIEFDQRIYSLFLLSQCKHFIVTTSTFNWWGAWLSNNKNKIIIRPDDDFFSNFRVNNRDFWPNEWIKLNF